MPTEVTTPPASITTDGTVQTLFITTTPGVYVLELDAALLGAGETIQISATAKVRAAGAALNVWSPVTLTGALAEPNILTRTMAVVAPQGVTFTIQRTAGADHAYPYRVDRIAACTVIAENSLVFTNNVEQIVTASVVNGTFVLLTDHSGQGAGDTVVLRLRVVAASGGTLRVVEMVTLAGVQADASGLARQQSVAEPSDYSMSAGLTQTAGANPTVPWALCQVGN